MNKRKGGKGLDWEKRVNSRNKVVTKRLTKLEKNAS